MGRELGMKALGLQPSPGHHQTGSRAMSSLSCFAWVSNASVPTGFTRSGVTLDSHRLVPHGPSPFALWSWVHSHQLNTPA